MYLYNIFHKGQKLDDFATAMEHFINGTTRAGNVQKPTRFNNSPCFALCDKTTIGECVMQLGAPGAPAMVQCGTNNSDAWYQSVRTEVDIVTPFKNEIVELLAVASGTLADSLCFGKPKDVPGQRLDAVKAELARIKALLAVLCARCSVLHFRTIEKLFMKNFPVDSLTASAALCRPGRLGVHMFRSVLRDVINGDIIDHPLMRASLAAWSPASYNFVIMSRCR